MKHKRLLTVLIAGVAAAALPDYAQAQGQKEGSVNSPVEQGPPPVEETDFPPVAFFRMIASVLHLTHPLSVDDSGIPAFQPRTGALHHKRTGGEARSKSAGYAIDVLPDRSEPLRFGPDMVTLSREEYDALRDLAAQAQAAAAADQTLYQAAAYQDLAGQTAAANASITDSNMVGQSSVPVLKVALPATSAVTRLPNQAPSATGVPPLRRKMKREE